MAGVIDGVAYLHRYAFAHNDIKPENVLYDQEKRNAPVLIDFGFSKFTPDGMRGQSLIHVITPLYRAPECLECWSGHEKEGSRQGSHPNPNPNPNPNLNWKEGSRQGYNAMAADMYSIGIMLYMVCYYDDTFKPKEERLHHYVESAYTKRKHHSNKTMEPWEFGTEAEPSPDLPSLPGLNPGLECLIRDLTHRTPSERHNPNPNPNPNPDPSLKINITYLTLYLISI